MIREAALEGRFYPHGKEAIFQQISEIERVSKYTDHEGAYNQTLGAVVPHAGHVYSGYQTLPFFRLLKKRGELPETFIILHPNHTGSGPDIALDPNESWRNSAGTVVQDLALGASLSYPFDAAAHKNEHSAEVIIPFIQYYFEGHPFQILPVCMKRQTSERAEELARRLIQAQRQHQRKVMVIASSDFSHFVSPEQGLQQDQLVLDQIEAKDTAAVEDTVVTNHITVCGYGPIMTLMSYAAIVNQAYHTSILARGHSGEIYPSREVVDYISILFYND